MILFFVAHHGVRVEFSRKLVVVRDTCTIGCQHYRNGDKRAGSLLLLTLYNGATGRVDHDRECSRYGTICVSFTP